jgi:hypothetical protein
MRPATLTASRPASKNGLQVGLQTVRLDGPVSVTL